MYHHLAHQRIRQLLSDNNLNADSTDGEFYIRLMANGGIIHQLYQELYGNHPQLAACFEELMQVVIEGYRQRSTTLRQRDAVKLKEDHWYLSNKMAGMSLYVDRFCGGLQQLPGRLHYLQNLGVNFLHLMPIFKSPEGESDGGYAVSDFRIVDARFGTLNDLKNATAELDNRGMYLMLDIVLNHTSHHHEWAQKAQAGDAYYQDFFYMYPNRTVPDAFEQAMPEVFPESAPGSFTWNEVSGKWVMTVFHNYQWDLNFTNPHVLAAMLDIMLFYANLGVDVLRIDAPAFIWKQVGTTCQNLPQAHTILRLLRLCVDAAAPGMALLAEAIVAPAEIMPYFGTGPFAGRECQFAYNATHMALQWDALATGDTRVMLQAQPLLLQKPYGATWLTYTRCHDDIGLGYDDYMIAAAGYNPYEHRRFLKDYYSGAYDGSPARGELFAVNPKTQDARISGSLASLCGLEAALESGDGQFVEMALRKIILMQAHSFFLGGVPMLFYGDEAAYTNDYSYLQEPGKSYDNRWMHRPVIDWERNDLTAVDGTPQYRVYTDTKKLLALRAALPQVADHSNLRWMQPHNQHVAGYLRAWEGKRLYCVFNFSDREAFLTWYAFKEMGDVPALLHDHWGGGEYRAGSDSEYLVLQPYGFYLLEG
jgi:amylosucrase